MTRPATWAVLLAGLLALGTITACSSGGSSSAPAPTPDFSLTVTPAAAIQAGNAGTAAVTLTRSGGHTAAVTLSLASNAQGITGSGSLAAGASSGTLNLTVPLSAAVASTSLTASASDGSLTHTASFTLNVTAPAKVLLVTANWGDESIRLTDDVAAQATGTVSPRIIKGAATQVKEPSVDAVAVDTTRRMIYQQNAHYAGSERQINVFHNALTVTGNIAPDRVLTMAAAVDLSGIELDVARDRLYFGAKTGSDWKLWMVPNASTANGAVTAAVQVPLPTAQEYFSLVLDTVNDRLWVGLSATPQLLVFNNASALSASSGPDRTITFTGLSTYGFSVHPQSDRLYLSSRDNSAGGYNVFVFAAASTLTGTVNPDSASAARIALFDAMGAMVDSQDRLYVFSDSATQVKIFQGAKALAGIVTRAPDQTLTGAISFGYGIDFLTY